MNQAKKKTRKSIKKIAKMKDTLYHLKRTKRFSQTFKVEEKTFQNDRDQKLLLNGIRRHQQPTNERFQ